MNKFLSGILFAAVLIAGGSDAVAVNPLDALRGVVDHVTATDKFEISALEGTWTYESPAVSFKSDNALNRAGGAAASAAIESKLEPYYTRLTLDSAKFTFDAEGNFTLALNKVTLRGTVTKDDDNGALTFHFKSSGKINLGKVSAFATKSATGTLTLTFDASRVISVVDKIASLSKNQTLTTVSSLLNSYDGVYAGAKFRKNK